MFEGVQKQYFKRTRSRGYDFFFAKDNDAAREQAKCFLFADDGLEQYGERRVCILKNQGFVLKYSKPSRWNVRLRKGLRLKRSGKNCLANEFSNLAKLVNSELSPTVHGYVQKKRFGLLFEELLVVEYFSNSRTISERIQADGDDPEAVLVRVLQLFSTMLSAGFVHLDPHPGNILITADGDLKFVDFEGCCFDIPEDAFCLAFCLGRLYRFWFKEFLSEERYDAVVSNFMLDEYPAESISGYFYSVYAAFKYSDTSRKQCYQYFSKNRARETFIASCVSTYNK